MMRFAHPAPRSHVPTPDQIAAVRAAVLAAFDGVPLPPGSEIALHPCDEYAGIRAAFAGQDWRAMPPALIEAHALALPLLSPRAYPYFLGAYLLYALDHFELSGPTEYLVYNLAPDVPRHADQAGWHAEHLRHVTAGQLAAIDAFMELVAADEGFTYYLDDLI
ncbi:MAG TPA: DUF6714 family protein [Longimicrobiaceae bacterium]